MNSNKLIPIIIRNLIGLIIVLFQAFLIYGLIIVFKKYVVFVFGGIAVIQLLFCIVLSNQDMLPEFKISWISFVLILPTIGLTIYFIIQVNPVKKRILKNLALYKQQFSIDKKKNDDPNLSNIIAYFDRAGFEKHTIKKIKYHSCGEDAFKDIIDDLKRAEKYILIEIFILAKGKLWDEILSILKEKIQANVEVKILYDGTCNFSLLPFSYRDELKALGIDVEIFSPFTPIINPVQNNRDHRKMIIIDGKIAYHGGYNIADEYVNQLKRFGYWKDTGIRFTGNAVNNMIIMFFEMWFLTNQKKIDVKKYFNQEEDKGTNLIIPFSDNPYDQERTSLAAYLYLINTAKKYIYIMTPYLILESQIEQAIIAAAKRGVKVNILMPFIPDKKIVYYIGRTFYRHLIQNGIEIFEFTKGFSHGKILLTDDLFAIVGSINLDFRSFYLNFENASFIYKDPVLNEIKKDFEITTAMSQKIDEKNVKEFGFIKKLLGFLFKIFSPLI